jgi:hypothetical protein
MAGPDKKKEHKVFPPLTGKRPDVFPKNGGKGDAEQERKKYGVEKPAMTEKMRIRYAEEKRQDISIRDNGSDYRGAPEIAGHRPLCKCLPRGNSDHGMGNYCGQ